MTIHKAVIPAAGLGTRFLPATKSTPKEMLPVVDKPAIQYVVEEAVRAGLDDVLLITGRSKRTLADHFDAVPELEAALEAKGDLERLAKVRESTDLGHVHFVRQGQPKGLGHAVLQAKHHVGAGAVRGPARRRPDRRARRAAEHDARAPGAHGRLGHRAAGGAAVADLDVRLRGGRAVRRWRRRRPGARHGARREARRGRGAEQPGDHRPVRAAPRGVRGAREHRAGPRRRDPADRRARDARRACRPTEGGGVYGVVFRGRRYDTGDRLDYLKAVVQIAVGPARPRPGLPRVVDASSRRRSADVPRRRSRRGRMRA